MKFARDTSTIFSREFTPELRAPVGLVLAMGQPLLFLVLFGPLLAGIQGADGASAWQWFVPGILVMMCLFGPMSAGHSLLTELTGGSMERLLVSPISRTAILVGRTLKESVILFVQAILIVAFALPLGFELHLSGVVAGMAMLTVFGAGLSSLSFVLAIASQPSGNLFWIVTQVLVFPLVLLSGVLLPVDAGPTWLQTLTDLNPVTYVVDALRALFAGRPAEPAVLHGVVAATAFAVVGLTWGVRAMRHAV